MFVLNFPAFENKKILVGGMGELGFCGGDGNWAGREGNLISNAAQVKHWTHFSLDSLPCVLNSVFNGNHEDIDFVPPTPQANPAVKLPYMQPFHECLAEPREEDPKTVHLLSE